MGAQRFPLNKVCLCNFQNWDALLAGVRDLDYGADPLGSTLKNIYEGADEDARRAMNKSYLESGGKVLSTNWNEVKEKKVEYKPRDT